MINDSIKILSSPVMYLKSVGPKRAESFAKIGIHTVKDLLFYFPSRYLDRSTMLDSSKIYEYVINNYEGEVTILGKVIDKEIIRYTRKEILKVQMRDSKGFFECVWFHGVKYMKDLFNPGNIFAVAGKPVLTKYGHLEFVHPDLDRITETESNQFLNTGKIIPVYRISKELKASNLGDLSLRRIINSAVEKYSTHLQETLPEDIISMHNLMPIIETVRNLHYPSDMQTLNEALHRLKFEEILYLEILIVLRKQNYQTKRIGNSFTIKTNLVSRFFKSLPFELTKAQLKVLGEIRRDMESAKPMNRLLQGDVGSGKTIVALIAMLISKDNGFQSALMVPTEVLAMQHFNNISRLVNPFGIKTALLIGGQKKSERNVVLKMLASGELDFIIGTHALFEESVEFNNLGFVIIDEQHRFGVAQRLNIISKGISPDVIVMSATPIPRTLSMTVYGDLDVSVIDEMPKNRKPIKTYLRGEKKLPEIYKFIIDKAKAGLKTYIIYPLVKESDKLELKAAIAHYEELKNHHLKNLQVGLIHGQMSSKEKDEAMSAFAQGQYDVLVGTTVIEVGIDIPEANIIIINDAHRFGLSQLHQLRGRVGRGNQQSFCILVTRDEFAEKINSSISSEFLSPSQLEKQKTITRLQSMVKYNSGFDIAEIDFKLRGPGDVFGVRQSGMPELKYVNVIEDTTLIMQARDAAFRLIAEDPNLSFPSHKVIRTNLISSYKDKLHYSKIA